MQILHLSVRYIVANIADSISLASGKNTVNSRHKNTSNYPLVKEVDIE